jgi:4-hydroxy-2-oxoheptanedioate aldolase
MPTIGRLNNMIRAWEEGRPAFGCFARAERQAALDLQGTPYDGAIFELEHGCWDPLALQDAMQYMMNRRQILTSGSFAPEITPMVRIPANGVEKNQFLAKQALDRGVYGVVWPHINNAEQAYNAVASCRYARKSDAPLYEPAGCRGDGPATASRYWGLTLPEYYRKADVWPLNPEGEILVILMIESVPGVDNIDEILQNVPGIGAVLIGEGDLSQALGHPRHYDHPVVHGAMQHVVEICKKHNVPVGHPHVSSANVESVVADGYRLILTAPVRTYEAIKKAKELAAK